MAFCPNCGSMIPDPTTKYCGNCGKSLGTEPSSNTPALQSAPSTMPPPQPHRYNKRNTIILISLIALPFLYAIFASVNQKSTEVTPIVSLQGDAFQTSERPKRFLESGFFKHIGENRNELVAAFGEPTFVKNGMYVYEEDGWRQIYTIKNGWIHDAMYQQLNVDSDNIASKVDDLVAEFGKNGFRRISDYDNVKRFRNGNYEISIMPIRTDIGTYNLGLMAFLK